MNKELARLRKENELLRQERDLLPLYADITEEEQRRAIAVLDTVLRA